MDKRKEVKNTCDKLVVKIIKFISESNLECEECKSIMYELSASLFTCASISQDDEAGDIESVVDNIQWLVDATLSSIYKFYHGDLDYIDCEEFEDD